MLQQQHGRTLLRANLARGRGEGGGRHAQWRHARWGRTGTRITSAQDRPLGFREAAPRAPRIVRDCASPCRKMPPAGNRSCSRCDNSGGSCRWCNLLQAEWEWEVGWEGGDHAHQPRGRSSRGFAPAAESLPDRIKCLNGEVMHPLPRTSDVFLFLGVDAGAALRAKEGLGCGIWRDGEAVVQHN